MPSKPFDNSPEKRPALSGTVETLWAFVSQAPSEMAMFDRGMRYIAASRGWIDHYRLPEDAMGRSHYDLYPDIPEHWRTVHQRALAGEVLSARDDRVDWEDGRTQWVNWEVRPWLRDSGDIGGIVIFAQDNTERRLAEQQANANAMLTNAILDSLPAQICVLDLQGNIVRINDAWIRFGAANSTSTISWDGAGWNYLAVCRRAVADGDTSVIPTLAGIEKVLSGAQSFFETEYPCHSPTEQRWFLLRVAPLKPGSGAVASHFDITERRRAEISLQRSYSEVRSLLGALETIREDERRRIAVELHDEFGQLLAATRINADWIKRKTDTPMPEVALKAGEISAIVDRARLATRRICADLRPRVLDDLGITQALRVLVAEFAKPLDLESEYIAPNNELPIGEPQATTLFRIAQESLSNIAKHAQASCVLVELSTSTDNVTLRVSDNGRGIKQEELSKANSFGLLGMRERVASLGGSVSISSSPGAGVTVEVRLPLGQDGGLRKF